MDSRLNKEYGEFLSRFNWDYFLTLRNCSRVKASTYTKGFDNYFHRVPYTNSLFYVVERDSIDWKNLHAHAVLQINSSATYNINQKALEKDLKRNFGRYYNIHLEPVKDNTGASMYLTKYISHKGISYDFLF